LRNRVTVVMAFVGMIAGAVAAPVLQSRFWPDAAAPGGLHVSGASSSGTATIVGVVLGFAAAAAGTALLRRLAGRRPLTTHPAVVRLQQEGWHFPTCSWISSLARQRGSVLLATTPGSDAEAHYAPPNPRSGNGGDQAQLSRAGVSSTTICQAAAAASHRLGAEPTRGGAATAAAWMHAARAGGCCLARA
jgi:hypothetical protein